MEDKLFYKYNAYYKIPKSLENDVYSSDKRLEYLENVNKVNLFIGANNSGKSKIIREILKEDASPSYNQEIIQEINNEIVKIRTDILNQLYQYRIATLDFWIQADHRTRLFDSNELKVILNSSLKVRDSLQPILNFSFALNNNSYTNYQIFEGGRSNSYSRQDIVNIVGIINGELIKLKNQINSIVKQPKWNNRKIYIPCNRTLRNYASTADLGKITRNEYGFNYSSSAPENEVIIHNGQGFYNLLDEYKRGEPKQKKKIKSFEDFLKDNFFNGNDIEITPRVKSDTVFIKIGKEQEQPIYNLGDGLQMLIILTFPFFTHDAGIIIIEEPEIFIHPGLHKKFLDFLVNHPATKNFQIFIATHSNHFIDAINESNLVSIFTVTKKYKNEDDEQLPDFVIENVAFGHENALSLLGVTNTSVYLANCTIWVEGITDKLYISKYITEYLKQDNIPDKFQKFKKYQEGVHYSFVYSGGDNIVHWDFDNEQEYEQLNKNIIASKLCGKAMVIVDNDFGKNREKRKKALKNLLGDRFIELEVPEIENLLSYEVIKNTILEYSTIAEKGESSLKEVTTAKIESTKLGTLIDEKILNGIDSIKRFSSSATNSDKSKGIKSSDKLDFCQKALKYITIANMSLKSKTLAEQVLNFIIDHNSKFI